MFKYQQELVLHAKYFHPNEKAFKCVQCGVLCSSTTALSLHGKTHKDFLQKIMSTTDKNSKLTANQFEEYKSNDLEFFDEYGADDSDTVNDVKYKKIEEITNMEIEYSNKQILGNDLMSEGSNLASNTCAICLQSFKFQHDLFSHAKTLHPYAKALKCPDCDVRFSSIKSFQTHKRAHEVLSFNKNVCEFCSKSFSQITDLKRHITEHTGEQVYPCAFCERTFKLQGSLLKHQRNAHIETCEEKMEVNKCAVCEKVFKYQQELIKHAKEFHPHGNALKCLHCDSRYSSIKSLSRHMQIHKDFSSKNICKICFFSCRDAAQLRSHSMIHTGERPYSCDECGKTFNKNYNLKSHMKMHTKPVAFSCRVCSKSYRHMGSLNAHLKKIHFIQNSSDSDEELNDQDNENQKDFTSSNVAEKDSNDVKVF